MADIAPNCPISTSQLPSYRKLFSGGNAEPTVTLSIPMAYDLPSLIRTVNIMRDVLRQLTTSLTVNNVSLPRPPNFKKKGDKYASQYPNWEEVGIETTSGIVFHKTKDGPDPESRAEVVRQNRVHFINRTQEDPEFKWVYNKRIK
jgi:hypothetical protein